MVDLRTEILIPARREHCYAQLVEFASYASWSPVHRRVKRTGQVLSLWLKGRIPMRLSANIRREEPPRALAWGGGLAPWLLDVHHYFELEALDDHTHLVHGERFGGVLGFVFAKFAGKSLLARYRTFNEAFAERCQRSGA